MYKHTIWDTPIIHVEQIWIVALSACQKGSEGIWLSLKGVHQDREGRKQIVTQERGFPFHAGMSKHPDMKLKERPEFVRSLILSNCLLETRQFLFLKFPFMEHCQK